MSTTMKAAIVDKAGDKFQIKQVPIPTPAPEQVLIKMICTGVCHTDVHAVMGDWPVPPKFPLIPGHEGVGEVVKLGSQVTHLQVGDRVGIPWLGTACLVCDLCLSGWETLCQSQKNSGYAIDGSFAEYAVADSRFVGKIPESVDSYEIAPIICAGVTVYKGLKMTDCKPGEWVAISGIGGLGHIAVQYAIAMGLRVVAVDVDDSKLGLAKEMGAEYGVNAIKEDPVAYIQNHTGGGVHGALVTAVSPKAFTQAVDFMRPGGTMVCNGLPAGTFDLSIFNLVLKGITVRGSIVGTRLDLKESFEFAANGKVKAHIAVEPIENINSIFDRLLKGKVDGRIVCDFK